MHIASIAFTQQGCQLACQLQHALEDGGHSVSVSGPARFADALDIEAYDELGTWVRASFARADALLFVSATGIAVRSIAPFVHDKFSDPAVVSIDEAANYVVPLLSGHVGGANALAQEIATAVGAQAVISTATDVNNLFAVDEWAVQHNLAILDRDVAKAVSAALLAKEAVGFSCDFPVEGELPSGLVWLKDKEAIPPLGIHISFDATQRPFASTLRLCPKSFVLGVGCKRGTAQETIAALVDKCLEAAKLSPRAVGNLASIDLKQNEQGLLELAQAHAWNTSFYTAEELAAVPGEFSSSSFVQEQVGVDNVCERAACATGGTLVQARMSENGVTVALANTEPNPLINFSGTESRTL